MESNATLTWREKKLQKRECKLMSRAETEAFLVFRPSSAQATRAAAESEAQAAKVLRPADEQEKLRLERRARRQAAEAAYLRRCEEVCAIAIDLGFSELMTLKEEKSLVQQILCSYGAIKNSLQPCRLHLCACDRGSRVEAGLRALPGFEKWAGVTMHPPNTPLEECRFEIGGGTEADPEGGGDNSDADGEGRERGAGGGGVNECLNQRGGGSMEDSERLATQNPAGAGGAALAAETGMRPFECALCTANEASFSMSNLATSSSHLSPDGEGSVRRRFSRFVYLTADSPNTVSALEAGTFYVIGGIVDRNRYKRLTVEKAERLGMSHAKLPLAEHAKSLFPRSSQVLTVNHVIQIMAHWLAHRDWATALSATLPLRKEQGLHVPSASSSSSM